MTTKVATNISPGIVPLKIPKNKYEMKKNPMDYVPKLDSKVLLKINFIADLYLVGFNTNR